MTPSKALSPVCGGVVPPWRTLLLSSLALVLYLLAGPAPELLIYDRAAIAGGEWWRLISGHWVHGDAEHALWNIAALVLFGALFEYRLGAGVLWSLVPGALAIDIWLWWTMPELTLYCGLSGALNALISAGLWCSWRETRDPVILWVAVAAITKIGLELGSSEALFTHTTWPSVPAVHAVGFAAGLLVSFSRIGICRDT